MIAEQPGEDRQLVLTAVEQPPTVDLAEQHDIGTSGPGPGWTNDAPAPSYTGCRQGYPGGRINGVYWWKPIPC